MKPEILALLQRNARMGLAEIADRLQTTPETVRELIAELEQERVILGYATLVDETKTGAPGSVRAIIEVEVQPERDCGFDRVARQIGKYPEVQTVYLVSGRYDLRLEVVGDSLQDVAFFVASKLSSLEGVKATATYFLLKKFKQAGFMMEEEEKHERLKVVP
ncbi:MAG: Lrp/AsnC family transcriptional regulator [Lentisphaeria bacterium]